MKHWNNSENADFYETISLDFLPGFAQKGGLNACCELRIIEPYLLKASAILEVGAGYGRILEKLTKLPQNPQIVAIERSAQFCQLLLTKFKDSAFILQQDINNLSLKQTFNVILWLWSGICDFSSEEQAHVFGKVASHLAPGGTLVIDSLPALALPINASESKGQTYFIEGDRGHNLHVYTPTEEELRNYGKTYGLEMKTIPYKTTTDRTRILYLFSH